MVHYVPPFDRHLNPLHSPHKDFSPSLKVETPVCVRERRFSDSSRRKDIQLSLFPCSSIPNLGDALNVKE